MIWEEKLRTESDNEKQDQIDNMFNANKLVGENSESLKIVNINLKKLNRTIVLNSVKNIQEIKDENEVLGEKIDTNKHSQWVDWFKW